MPEVTPKEAPDPRSLLGYDGTDFYVLKVDGDGHLQIDDLGLATLPVAHRVIMTLADTEYSQLLPANCKRFLVKCRTNYPIRVAFTEGWTATTYLTVPAGMTYWEDSIQITGLTLYLRCMTAGQVAEIVAWV